MQPNRNNLHLVNVNSIREQAMPAFTVKNIPDDLYAELKATAQLHRRSVNSEVIVCLEKVLKPNKVSSLERLDRIRALRLGVPASTISAQEIAQTINSGRP